jgi:hypothetical protein
MNKNLPSKMTTMKKILFAFLAITIMSTLFVACNSNPKVNNEDVARKVADSLRLAADTAGLSQFQAWKAQNELPNVQDQGQAQQFASAPSAVSNRTSRSTSRSRSYSSGSMNSSSSNTAKAKKGWSKAAKGAVIGGVAGGAAGAIINKRNRVVGGVVGGILGAGVGYGIGRAKDKKDGRY